MVISSQWKIYFRNEEELIKAVANIDVHKFNKFFEDNDSSPCQYITRASRAINSDEELSDPQIRHLKRLAKHIRRYYDNVQ